MQFKLWLESDSVDNIKDAIISELPSEIVGNSRNPDDLLNLPLNQLSSDVLDRIKNLGAIATLDFAKKQEIIGAIKHGATIADILQRITS